MNDNADNDKGDIQEEFLRNFTLEKRESEIK